MSSFYSVVDSGTYKNIFYALNIALKDFLANKLLNGDLNRIEYASSPYALTKRAGKGEWNNANLPFINLKMSDKTLGGERNWFNFGAYSQGIYIDELRQKLRVIPVTISYDSTYWTSRTDDLMYATDALLIDAAAETKIEYYLDYNGFAIKNIAIITFDSDASPQYTEQDWLEKNKIESFVLNPKIQTWLPVGNTSGFCIPKTILMDFAVKKGLLDGTEVMEQDELLEFVIDHDNETITPV